jgi:hypothetical protein
MIGASRRGEGIGVHGTPFYESTCVNPSGFVLLSVWIRLLTSRVR